MDRQNARKVGRQVFCHTQWMNRFEFLDDLHLDPEIVLALRDFHHTSLWARAGEFCKSYPWGRFGFSR